MEATCSITFACKDNFDKKNNVRHDVLIIVRLREPSYRVIVCLEAMYSSKRRRHPLAGTLKESRLNDRLLNEICDAVVNIRRYSPQPWPDLDGIRYLYWIHGSESDFRSSTSSDARVEVRQPYRASYLCITMDLPYNRQTFIETLSSSYIRAGVARGAYFDRQSRTAYMDNSRTYCIVYEACRCRA